MVDLTLNPSLLFLRICSVSKNPILKSTPSRMMPTNENMYRREIFFPSALQCLFFIDQKTFLLPQKNTFRHGTKPTTKCFSRLRLNILGFLYLISFFLPSQAVSLLKNDILTFVTMAIMCGTIYRRKVSVIEALLNFFFAFSGLN